MTKLQHRKREAALKRLRPISLSKVNNVAEYEAAYNALGRKQQAVALAFEALDAIRGSRPYIPTPVTTTYGQVTLDQDPGDMVLDLRAVLLGQCEAAGIRKCTVCLRGALLLAQIAISDGVTMEGAVLALSGETSDYDDYGDVERRSGGKESLSPVESRCRQLMEGAYEHYRVPEGNRTMMHEDWVAAIDFAKRHGLDGVHDAAPRMQEILIAFILNGGTFDPRS